MQGQFYRSLGHGLHVKVDMRYRRTPTGKQGGAIETDDLNGLGYGRTREQQAHRRHVIVSDNGSKFLFENRLPSCRAARAGGLDIPACPGMMHAMEFEFVMRSDVFKKRLPAGEGVGRNGLGAIESHGLVIVLDEVLADLFETFFDIDMNLIATAITPTQPDDFASLRLDLFGRKRVIPFGPDDHDIDRPADKSGHTLGILCWVGLAMRCKQQFIAMGLEFGFKRDGQLRKKRIADVPGSKADGHRAIGFQTLGIDVGDIAKLVCNLFDALECVIAESAVATGLIQDAGHRGIVYA